MKRINHLIDLNIATCKKMVYTHKQFINIIALVTYPDLKECQREYINASYMMKVLYGKVYIVLYYRDTVIDGIL